MTEECRCRFRRGWSFPASGDYRTAGRRARCAGSGMSVISFLRIDPWWALWWNERRGPARAFAWSLPSYVPGACDFAPNRCRWRARCRSTVRAGAWRHPVAAVARRSRDQETRRIAAAASRRRGTGHSASVQEAVCFAWPFQAPPSSRLPSCRQEKQGARQAAISTLVRSKVRAKEQTIRARSAAPSLPRTTR